VAPAPDTPPDDSRPSLLGLPVLVALTVGVLTALFGGLTSVTEGPVRDAMQVGFLLAQVGLVSIVIWQACDPFADAAQWIGTEFRIPGSVRGATLDAVASSLPELFTGVIFVIVATSTADADANRGVVAGEGYGAAIATCAGSAVYNMILIPAFCALVISFRRRWRPTIDVDPEVLARDGLWYLGTSLLLIGFLSRPSMTWWMAVALFGAYVVYIVHLWFDTRHFRVALAAVHEHFGESGHDHSDAEVVAVLRSRGQRIPPSAVKRVREALAEEEEQSRATAGILFGLFAVPLNGLTAAGVIAVATLVAAAACWWLVALTEAMAVQLGAPLFFVAVIMTAAASSVPDTFLSIGAALRGDDSGAVSNAFGSNVFNICVGLAVPLLVSSALLGWQPVSLLDDGRPMEGLVDLQVLLAVLTIVTLAIMWHRRQLTRTKAIVLCLLYGLFIAYAVAGSLGYGLFGSPA
jgi:Ca2+/Na+ antiporter